MDRQFGRYSIADDRDDFFPIRTVETGRSSRIWNANWSGNQGSTPQCVGYAWAHWLAAYPIMQYLDPTGIYTFAQHVDEWYGINYDGTSVRAGAKVLKSLGFISEYRWTRDVEVLANVVLETGPVVVGTNWYEGMDEGVPMTAEGRSMGGHAWLIDGVDTSKRKFRAKNSWGPEWGIDGRNEIGFDTMSRLLEEDGECCVGVESRPLNQR